MKYKPSNQAQKTWSVDEGILKYLEERHPRRHAIGGAIGVTISTPSLPRQESLRSLLGVGVPPCAVFLRHE